MNSLRPACLTACSMLLSTKSSARTAFPSLLGLFLESIQQGGLSSLHPKNSRMRLSVQCVSHHIDRTHSTNHCTDTQEALQVGLHAVGRSREVTQDGQQHRSLYCPADTTSSLTMMRHPEVQQLFVCDVPTVTAPSQESRKSHGD